MENKKQSRRILLFATALLMTGSGLFAQDEDLLKLVGGDEKPKKGKNQVCV